MQGADVALTLPMASTLTPSSTRRVRVARSPTLAALRKASCAWGQGRVHRACREAIQGCGYIGTAVGSGWGLGRRCG